MSSAPGTPARYDEIISMSDEDLRSELDRPGLDWKDEWLIDDELAEREDSWPGLSEAPIAAFYIRYGNEDWIVEAAANLRDETGEA